MQFSIYSYLFCSPFPQTFKLKNNFMYIYPIGIIYNMPAPKVQRMENCLRFIHSANDLARKPRATEHEIQRE